ncbi:glycosyltransferase family 39 protein [Chloroflexota bacterium]
MIRSRRAVTWLLAAILLIYLALALWYSTIVPLGEAPDEVPHFTVVRFLARNGRLPTGTDEHEAWQPPLYYALGAALTFWIEDAGGTPFAARVNAHFDPVDPRAPKNLLLHSTAEAWPYRGWALSWHLVRLVSVVLGAITVWAVFRLGDVVFPEQPAIAVAMAALTAFTPQFIFISAVVNNDNAATALSAVILWQVAELLHDGDCARLWRRAAILGLLLGLAVLSKASLIALLPIVAVAIVVASARCSQSADPAPGSGGAPWRSSRVWLAFRALALAFGVWALLAGWYYARNWQLYGDPMGWSFLQQTHALREGPLTPDLLVWLFRGVYRSFWLGWIGIGFDGLLYWLIGLASLVGAAGFVAWLARCWKALDRSTRWTLAILGLHAAITVASLVQWTATVQGTDQGRLIYPILPTVMLALAGGWAWWAKGRAQPWVLGSLSAGMLCLAVVTPVLYIAPVHAAAPVATEGEMANATPLNVSWEDVRLMGYRLESAEVPAGGELVLDLYWEGRRPTERDLLALIQLVDSQGQFLMYVDGSPTAGRDTTDRWTAGVPLASRHLLPVPAYGQPGEYQITISLHPFDQENWLPGEGPEGALPGDQLVLPETVYLTAP